MTSLFVPCGLKVFRTKRAARLKERVPLLLRCIGTAKGYQMTAVDPWEKAADCERSLQAAVDPQRRAILSKIRDMWVALGNEKSLMLDADVAQSAEAINRMHVELTA